MLHFSPFFREHVNHVCCGGPNGFLAVAAQAGLPGEIPPEQYERKALDEVDRAVAEAFNDIDETTWL